MPIVPDSRTTRQTQTMMKDILSNNSSTLANKKIDALKKKLEAATDWNEKCDIDAQIEEP